MAAVGLVAERAEAAAYVFTNIADTSSGFDPGFGRQPSVNSTGAVAFYGERPADRGIFKGSAGAVTPIATDAAAGQFFGFSDKFPSINASGVVAFGGDLDNGNLGIFKGSGGPVTQIAQDGGAFGSFGSPTINTAGNVAFFATYDTGVPTQAILVGAGGAVTTIDADTGPRGSYGRRPTINTAGTVAFQANIDTGGSGIFASSGGTVTPIAQTSASGFSAFNDPSINDAGLVAFRGEIGVGGATRGIYKGSGGPTTTVVESGNNLFSNFTEAVSINNTGSVAFVGLLFAGGRGLYVDTNGVRERVIGTGDSLFGSTVIANSESDFGFGNTALNDLGQLTFFYTLADGRTGIALASVPEPASGAFLVAATACFAWRRRRR